MTKRIVTPWEACYHISSAITGCPDIGDDAKRIVLAIIKDTQELAEKTQKDKRAEKEAALATNIDNLQLLDSDDRFEVIEKSEYHYHITYTPTAIKFNYWPSTNRFQGFAKGSKVMSLPFNDMVGHILKQGGE